MHACNSLYRDGLGLFANSPQLLRVYDTCKAAYNNYKVHNYVSALLCSTVVGCALHGTRRHLMYNWVATLSSPPHVTNNYWQHFSSPSTIQTHCPDTSTFLLVINLLGNNPQPWLPVPLNFLYAYIYVCILLLSVYYPCLTASCHWGRLEQTSSLNYFRFVTTAWLLFWRYIQL